MNNTELERDIQTLREDHGVSLLLTESLIASPKEAHECIRFFKQMMYLFNGGLIALGFVLVWYGLTNHTPVRYVLVLIGSILVVRFVAILIRQRNAVQAMESIANKHSLI